MSKPVWTKIPLTHSMVIDKGHEFPPNMFVQLRLFALKQGSCALHMTILRGLL